MTEKGEEMGEGQKRERERERERDCVVYVIINKHSFESFMCLDLHNLNYNSLCDAAGMLGMQKECGGEAHSLEQKQADWASSYCALFSMQDGSSKGF